MSRLDLPRIVIVTRRTPLELLLERCGTRGQAEFYLRTQGQALERYQEQQDRFERALHETIAQMPTEQKRTRVDRDALDRFLFQPDDLVVIVGQDGLVANVAKYLTGQPVIAVNSDPTEFDGVLCAHRSTEIGPLILRCNAGESVAWSRRRMVEALREDGQRILALNEVFVGHRSHQSARYTLHVGGVEERQSSSGIIVSTGTGATGWARSIARQRRIRGLPKPTDGELAWFVREPFPSQVTGTSLDHGSIAPPERLEIHSAMGVGGVAFGDGIESDWLEFLDGQTIEIGVAESTLNLVSTEARAERESARDMAHVG